jgi:dihydrofolate reductase
MIIIIAAIGANRELGKDNDLIWHLPADLKRFKKVTTGHAIIMGRNTFESIGKPLPNRRSIIITRNPSYKKEGCEVVHSLEDAIELIHDQDDAFIIGGAQIYNEAMEKNLVDQLDITEVHQNFDADVFFPSIDSAIWKEVAREQFFSDEKNAYNYSFLSYQRTI